ncbi:hypothetical protein DFP72DRAFT_1146906 [Ephemerocybe angulata]|uniref:Uncharacterized protein n=1 Tax=Ephemerocybe angulata TaxID=980116 RepID=A0A8H6HJ86_9AGAR|nr:hypothetical protein DFP72DRAFT_1146906 [Tulosesus angulatus]
MRREGEGGEQNQDEEVGGGIGGPQEDLGQDGASGNPESSQSASSDAQPIPRRLNLTKYTTQALSTLCSTATKALVALKGGQAMSSDVYKVMRRINLGDARGPTTMQRVGPAGSLNALIAVATICEHQEVSEAIVHLSQYLGCIEFAAHVQKRKADSNNVLTNAAIYEEMNKELRKAGRPIFSEEVLRRHYAIGAKTAFLAGAGSVYILPILAAARIKWIYTTLPCNMVAEIARLIRAPDDSAPGKLVKNSIIPLVCRLRKDFPMTLDVLFSDTFIGLRPSSIWVLNCADIDLTDKFFDAFLFNIFVTPRNWEAWAAARTPIDPDKVWCLNDIFKLQALATLRSVTVGEIAQVLYADSSFQSSDDLDPDGCALAERIPSRLGASDPNPSPLIPIDWNNTAKLSNMVNINTKYNPEFHKRAPFDRYDRAKRLEFTERHRAFAASAKTSDSVHQLRRKLQDQLRDGLRTYDYQYTLLDGQSYDGQVVRINDKNNDLVVLLLANMPLELRTIALDSIRSIFPGAVKHQDSKTANNSFPAFHFDMYNRYSTTGKGTASDAEPSTIVNPALTGPRESREARLLEDEKARLQEAFAPIFDHISGQLRILLPEEFKKLEAYIEVLPLGETSSMYPLTGFVVNINVVTIVHRDWKDKEICIVFQFSDDDCIGGGRRVNKHDWWKIRHFESDRSTAALLFVDICSTSVYQTLVVLDFKIEVLPQHQTAWSLIGALKDIPALEVLILCYYSCHDYVEGERALHPDFVLYQTPVIDTAVPCTGQYLTLSSRNVAPFQTFRLFSAFALSDILEGIQPVQCVPTAFPGFLAAFFTIISGNPRTSLEVLDIKHIISVQNTEDYEDILRRTPYNADCQDFRGLYRRGTDDLLTNILPRPTLGASMTRSRRRSTGKYAR